MFGKLKSLSHLEKSVLGLIFAILMFNAFNHPTDLVYDHKYHTHAILDQSSIGTIIPSSLDGNLQYNPYLPYYIMGKINYVLTFGNSINVHPYYWIRVVQSLMYLCLISLIITNIFKKETHIFKAAAIASFFVIPNNYLSLVMIRADHFLSLGSLLFIYLWFCRGMKLKVLYDRKWRLVCFALIAFLANTRHIAVISTGLFLIITFLTIWKNSNLKKIELAKITLITVLVSIHFYGLRYISSGNLFKMGTYSSYHKKFEVLRENFDRKPFLTNLEFDKAYELPNRLGAGLFKNVNGSRNSYLPKLYSDMWGDYWLYFSGPEAIDHEIKFKRFSMVFGIPFSLILIFSIASYLISSSKKVLSPEKMNIYEVGAILSFFGFILFTLINYIHPEVGKNGFVKFSYCSAYLWPGILCIMGQLSKLSNKFKKIYYIYITALFLGCLPLFIYTQEKLF